MVLLGTSCSPTRHLAEGEYLLDRTVIDLRSKDIDKAELQAYQKQTPNKTILGIKFHLFLYNLSKPDRTRGIGGWLKRIGEEPVIWNPVLTERTTDQFKRYLETKGYYQCEVTDSVKLVKGRAEIEYNVVLNEPYRIKTMQYVFEDQSIKDLVLKDTANCLIKVGDRFDKEIMQNERQRIEDHLKNNGYFNFSKEYIFFEAKEIPGTKDVNLKILIKENIRGIPDPETKVKHHWQYRISSTYIFPDFELRSDARLPQENASDSVIIGNNHILYSGTRHRIRPEAILLPNRCNPGDLYSLNNVKKSYNNYSSMGLYRLINIQFNELNAGGIDTGKYKYLDCQIELSPRDAQSYQTEVVGTNTVGDFGVRANFIYNNYNLLRGAENFQMKLTGAYEQGNKRYQALNEGDKLTMKEFGIESTLTLPKFLVPFKAQKFTRKYYPRTSINISYNYQDRPGYARHIGSTFLSYKWKINTFTTHQLYPIDFNYVWLPDSITDQSLLDDITGTPMEASFRNHTIMAARYTFEYTNRDISKETDYIFFRANLESAGNVIYSVYRLASLENDSLFLNVPYFRYLKGDFEFRSHNKITSSNKIVYRIFTGVGYPLGKSEGMPYEKMYFAGGPNGIRAWNTLELGPGSDTTSTLSYASKLGDIRLEANLEYRFKLFWVMEGALFVDAGNIWTMNIIKDRIGAEFKWNRFYKEIAVGTGIGVRFDFSYLLIRLDVGYKLRDPSIYKGSRWIDFNNNKYPYRRTAWQFGIDYPF